MNLNRRMFLAVTGAAGGAAIVFRPKSGRFPQARPLPPVHFFSDLPGEPPARPKSSAIHYLASQQRVDIPYA